MNSLAWRSSPPCHHPFLPYTDYQSEFLYVEFYTYSKNPLTDLKNNDIINLLCIGSPDAHTVSFQALHHAGPPLIIGNIVDDEHDVAPLILCYVYRRKIVN